MKIFSLFDSKAGAFTPPFFAASAGVAIRMTINAGSDPNTDLHRHGADFTLMEIGEWDELTGVIMPLEVKINLGTVLQLLSIEEAKARPRLTAVRANGGDQVDADEAGKSAEAE